MEKTIEVTLTHLPSLRVASVHGFGAEPEMQAWEKLVSWAKPKGYMDELPRHRIFGFNNPDPSPISPNYGYEFWMAVGPEEQPEGEVSIKSFEGGLYAMLPCPVPKGNFDAIGQGWKKLIHWRENNPYEYDHSRQWLEEHFPAADPSLEFVLHLYMPVTGGK